MEYCTECSPAPGIRLRIKAGDGRIRSIDLNPDSDPAAIRTDQHPCLSEAARQLTEYFAGDRDRFDLELDMHGTPFQLRVWEALRGISYGRTCSYADLARAVGSPAAVRAVGAANGRNPIPIVVPCHRVIGANGSLVGYGGGLPLKKLLLDLEARHVERFRQATAR